MATFTHTHDYPIAPSRRPGLGPLTPLRRWIDRLEVNNRRLAYLVCRVIPCCCPFERDVTVLGYRVHIPALCELDPVYDERVALRFRALSYLSDVCGEDVTRYVC